MATATCPDSSGHYLSLTDVKAELPGIPIDANSKPSTTDVEGWIGQISSETNVKLLKFGVPKVQDGTRLDIDSDACLYLAMLATCAVAARVLRSLGYDEDEDQRSSLSYYQSKWDDGMEEIAQNPSLVQRERSRAGPSGVRYPEGEHQRVTRFGIIW